jgi:hypothetical protein
MTDRSGRAGSTTYIGLHAHSETSESVAFKPIYAGSDYRERDESSEVIG